MKFITVIFATVGLLILAGGVGTMRNSRMMTWLLVLTNGGILLLFHLYTSGPISGRFLFHRPEGTLLMASILLEVLAVGRLGYKTI